VSDQVEHSPPIDDAGEHSGGLARRVASFLRLEEIPAALGLTEVRAAARPVWTPDFVVLCVLVAGTIMLGRPFSKEVKLPGGPIYVTEVAVVAMAAFALWRLRLGGVWARVRKVVPLVPLLVFWLAGAIAALRGLHTYGFHQIVPDIGLVEFSIFVPLVAVVVDTRERLARLFAVVLAAGIVITIVYALLWNFDPLGWFMLHDPSVAIALYMSLAALFVVARLVSRSPVTPLEIVYAAVALILVSVTTARASIVALASAFIAMVVLSPRRRAFTALLAAGALALSFGGAFLFEKLRPSAPPLVIVLPTAPFGHGFAADDISRGFVGGGIEVGDAAEGRYSRRVALHQRFELSGLTGLVPGRRYTIEFAVRPLAAQVVAGVVGDPTGLRWGLRYWQTKPVPKWQFFRRTLGATQGSETVGLVAYSGSQNVLFDGVRVVQASRAAGRLPPPPPPPPGAPAAPPPPRLPSSPPPPSSPLIREFGVLGGKSQEANNVHWRLAMWRFMLEETAHDPVFGVGFGKPTNFVWRGMIYDARTGDKTNTQDVTGPHNSFVNILFRMGLLGLLPLVALLVIAGLRSWRVLVRGTLSALDRAFALTSVAMVVAVAVTACFSVALEGPYMGLFFWLALGLVLALPRLLTPKPSEASD
jgi:hypothetical protein